MVLVRGPRALRLAQVCAVALGTFGAVRPAQAQDQSPLNLPREGLDYAGYRLGTVTVVPQVTFRTEYDNNLYATDTATVDDVRAEISPSVALYKNSGRTTLSWVNYATAAFHAENSNEDWTAFGTALRVSSSAGGSSSFSARLGFDRTAETRADPERRVGPLDPPRKVDALGGELGFGQRFGQFGINLTGAADKINYNGTADEDRDMTTWRGAVRLSVRTRSSLEGFVEGYVNKRDFRLATDFSGINRDTTTVGANVGVQREIGQRLRGRIGVGLFRSNPDDPALASFSGLGAAGDITWTPRVRTQVNLKLARGDVATVRAGATGRIDSSIRLGVDQEIRHNLLGRFSIGYIDRQYRGSSRGHLKTFDTRLELEYLMNPRLSLFGGGTFMNRAAPSQFDRFDKAVASVGIRFRI